MPADAPRVAVIIGSTRPARICPDIARRARQALSEGSPLAYEIVDLAEIGLPFLDEPRKPALGGYRQEHTRAWSRLVSGYQGFVFVFPQYNWGYPAVLKNALDFLYREWHGKPVSSVTYGTRGGGKGADQIRQVFEGLHMRILPARVEIPVPGDAVDAGWQLADPDATVAACAGQLRQLDRDMTAALRDSQD